jgi:hypothetical protein
MEVLNMGFKKYMHIEKFGNDEVQGIELGECYIFPKIDGTNASAWMGEDGIEGGSRNRKLSLDNDNAGFYNWLVKQDNISGFTFDTGYRLYGEWLVPHSLKTYVDSAWKRFYIFDVYDDKNEKFISYDKYHPILEEYNIDYVPTICTIRNPKYESLLRELNNNNFLIQDGCGNGEGIVIKNYNYENIFGRVCWAKIITNSFKEKHTKAMGPCRKNEKEMIEQAVVDKYVDKHLVDKTYAKIVNEMNGWNSKYIPRLFSTVYYDLVKECSWDFVKENKMPTINFKTLNTLTIIKIKELRNELF